MIIARTARHEDGNCSGCNAMRSAIVVLLKASAEGKGLPFKLCEGCCDDLPEVIKNTVKAAR